MEAPEAAANAIVVLQAVLPGNTEITFETNMRKRARKFRENCTGLENLLNLI